MTGDIACNWIEENAATLTDLSDKIGALAEISLKEYQSAKLLQNELSRHGFEINSGVAGLPTAFTASWGQGKPIIGFLGEYDALPKLSQKAVSYKEPVSEDSGGHGCGHNLLGVGALGAALALKEEMEKNNLDGTIVYYGCPAEETMIGKINMAREGLFDNLSAALTWHPGGMNSFWGFRTLAMNSVKFSFSGRTAHAAADPYNGRSALDAVELMNVGANYLREHIIPDARIHYVITNGGTEPNIVPDKAQSLYFIRAPKRKQLNGIYARVIKIAKGAALMTETELDIELITGCYDYQPNASLGKILYESMEKTTVPEWTAEEEKFAGEIASTFLPGQREIFIDGYKKLGGQEELKEKFLHDGITPFFCIDSVLPNAGSTDVGDVSYIVPTAQMTTCCSVMGSAGHSWQITAASNMSIGHKGMLYAAKVLAMTGSSLIRNPDLINQAHKEHIINTCNEKYKCAISKEEKVMK